MQILDFLYLDYELMDFPNQFAVKALLQQKLRDLGRKLGEKDVVIGASKRETGQIVAPCSNAAIFEIFNPDCDDPKLFIHRPNSQFSQCSTPLEGHNFRRR
jgi:hypothetical protein